MSQLSRQSSGQLTDVPGISVGCWSDPVGMTGCTVVLCPGGAIAAVDVRGGAPGTRETDLLAPGMLVERVHGILLAGGSAFGLAAATGVMGWLSDRGHGFPSGPGEMVVPIVPAAVVFDLAIGDPRAFPDHHSGVAACDSSGSNVAEGSVGAGTGCTTDKLFGPSHALPGGQGTASLRLDEAYGGFVVGALMVVNAVGHVGGSRRPNHESSEGTGSVPWYMAPPGGLAPARLNTTIGVVATDAPIDRQAALRIAWMAHDGLARAIDPVHTPFDGDVIFVLSTALPDVPNRATAVDGHRWGRPTELTVAAIGAAAADLVAAAVIRGVHAGRRDRGV
ncbi:MAG: peptidase S58 family protein [Chloroflexi bacterium]|nr:peptidase S58 family protein [Chloroflexota bacterium]